MLRLREEAAGDGPAREALLDRCFGPLRRLKTCERLRRERLPAPGLALSAVEDGRLVGTLRLWHIAAGSAGAALLLGPLAVAPERQGEGIGAALMRLALRSAASLGHRAVLLVGDAPYYARFGFAPAPAGLSLPGPVERARFLGLELCPGSLAGAAGPVTATGRRRPSRQPARRSARALAA